MSSPKVLRRTRLLSQVAAVALLAGLSAACSNDATRLASPYVTNSVATNHQRSFFGDGNVASTAPVQQSYSARQPLPPAVNNYNSQPLYTNSVRSSAPAVTNSIQRQALPPVTRPQPVSQNITAGLEEPAQARREIRLPFGNRIPLPTRTPKNLARQTLPQQQPLPPVVTQPSPQPYTQPQVYSATIDRTTTASLQTQKQPVVPTAQALVPSAGLTAYTAPVPQRRAPRLVNNFQQVPQQVYTASPSNAAQLTPSAPLQQPIDNTITSAIQQPQQTHSTRSGGWSGTGGTRINVRPGETLYTLSRRFGVPVKELARVNNISDPSGLQAGQQVVIPTYVFGSNVGVSAPDADKNVRDLRFRQQAEPVIAAPQQALPQRVVVGNGGTTGQYYTVQPGDTLGHIAGRHGTSVSNIQAANGLQPTQYIRVGQRLMIPGTVNAGQTYAQAPSQVDPITTASIAPTSVVGRVVNSSVATPRSRPIALRGAPSRQPIPAIVNAQPTNAQPQRLAALPRSRPRAVATAAPRVNPSLSIDRTTTATIQPKTQYQKPAVEAKPQQQVASVGQQATQPVNAGGNEFRWPTRGPMVAGFGKQADGKQNDGVNIKVPAGTAVRAAEAGEVIYAAGGLKGYGNLVLIRHKNGWVSAYAHNSSLNVRQGDKVRRGQVISRAGQTGSVESPQVHFELRKNTKPVNPLPYLQG